MSYLVPQLSKTINRYILLFKGSAARGKNIKHIITDASKIEMVFRNSIKDITAWIYRNTLEVYLIVEVRAC